MKLTTFFLFAFFLCTLQTGCRPSAAEIKKNFGDPNVVIEDIPYDANKGKTLRVKFHNTKFNIFYGMFDQVTPNDLKRYYPEPLDMIITDESTDPKIISYYKNEFKPTYRNYIWVQVRVQDKLEDGHTIKENVYDQELILPSGRRKL